jgi:protein SCO1/2
MPKVNPALKRKNRITIIFLLAFIALTVGLYVKSVMTASHLDTSKLNATLLDEPRAVSPFQLIDHQGQAFTRERFSGRWNLVFFGFAHCPEMCPTAMNEIAKTFTLLEAEQVKQYPQVVFISIDPERDTPAVLKNYLSQFNPAFIGVTGKKDQIEALTKELGIVYLKTQMAEGSKEYDINHSGTIVLFNPAGKIAGFMSLPHKATQIAADYKLITRQG